MTTVTIRIPMPLRSYAGNAAEVRVEATTVGEALRQLCAAHGGVTPRILSPQGELREFVNVFVGDRNIRSLGGLATRLAEGDVLVIVPAVAGGEYESEGRPSRTA